MKNNLIYGFIAVILLLSCNNKPQLTGVPDYHAQEYKKDSVALREVFKNKVSVVNMWFTICTPCLKEIPFLTQVYNNYKGNPDFAFYSVAANTSNELDQFLDPDQDSTNIHRKAFLSYNLQDVPYPILIGTRVDRKMTKTLSNGVEGMSVEHTDRESMDEITRYFKSNSYPTTLIFDKNGKEVFRESGFNLNKAESYKQKLMSTIDSCLAL